MHARYHAMWSVCNSQSTERSLVDQTCGNSSTQNKSWLALHGVRSGMASIQLQLPHYFDFKDPDSWAHWRCMFQQLYLASSLAAVDDNKQISYLMYCLGEDMEETLASMNISAGDQEKFNTILAKFEKFFNVRKCHF